MTGLEEGVNYEFRVRGVNEAGVGVASMSSDPMSAKSLAGIVPSKSFSALFAFLFSSCRSVKGTFLCVPLCAQGSQEVSCTVDKKTGDIVLSFESCVMNQGSQFIWKKDYEEITDLSKGMVVKTEGNT